MSRWAGAASRGLRCASSLHASWPTCPGPVSAGASILSFRFLSTRPGRRRGRIAREETARESGSNLSPNSLPQLDWGFVTSSVGSLSSVFLEMVLPEPGGATGRKKKNQRSRWSFNWYATSTDVAAAYRRSLRESGGGTGSGRLVRGIIYEMSSLMVPVGAVTKQGNLVTKLGAEGEESEESESGSEEGGGGLSEHEEEKLRNAELARRDWQGYLMKGAHGSSSAEKKREKERDKEEGRDKARVTRGITLEELSVQMEEDESHTPPSNRFGLNRAASSALSSGSGAQTSGTGAQDNTPHRVTPRPSGVPKADASTGGAPKTGVPLANRREREIQELLGGARGEAIRAKYAGRLQEKQMLADARMQQGKTAAHGERMAFAGRARRAAKNRTWLPMPGLAGILRHFKVGTRVHSICRA